MGLIPCSKNRVQLFESLEMILNKSTIASINNNIKKPLSEEDRINYEFICSLINYYQSLKNNQNMNKKYSYYYISQVTKNINAFCPLKKAKELFINWVNLLYKNNKNNIFIYDKEIEINQIKNLILYNINQYKLYNVFKENFYNYYNNIDNKSFIKLILLGLPDFLRPIIWKMILKKKNKNNIKLSIKNFLNQNDNNPNIKQINKDINRTFINEGDNNLTIEKIDDEKINKLKIVLIALSNYNTEIGYTQGMNNIIGFLLKVTKFDEEKTFELAVLILDKIKGYFIKDFPLLKENLKKFNNEFKKRNNKLYNHFKQLEIIDELWISKWLQTLFTIIFPFNEICRLWDSLIVYGFDFIIYLSLSIIYFAEDELLKLNDSSDIIEYFTEMMNSNKKIKKYIDIEPDYKDYIIPLYNIISRAKKIKREILVEFSYFNALKNSNRILRYSNKDFNLFEFNNFSHHDRSNLSYSKLNCNSSSYINKTGNNSNSIIKLKKNKNPSSGLSLSNNTDSFSSINLKQEEKSENNKYLKINRNNLRKYSYQSDNNSISNISNKNNNLLNNNNDFKNLNYINIKNTKNDVNVNNKNYNIFCFSGINNLNANTKIYDNYVNGRPRRNMRILVHKKNILPSENIQMLNESPHYVSKSPDYNRIISNDIQNLDYYNLKQGYIQNNDFVNNNKYIFNPVKRGSYNISLPVKYNFGYRKVSI